MGIRKLVQSQGRVVVADFGEPVHMHRKDKIGGGGGGVKYLPGKKKGRALKFFRKKMKNSPALPPN